MSETTQTNIVAPSSTAGAAQPTAAGSKVTTGDEMNSSTQISSMEDLKQQSPKVFKAIMQGLAENICERMKKNQENSKKIAQQYQNT